MQQVNHFDKTTPHSKPFEYYDYMSDHLVDLMVEIRKTKNEVIKKLNINI